MKLTQELCDRIIQHLEDQRADIEKGDEEETGINEVDDAIEMLRENVGDEIGDIDYSLITRLMDDEELHGEIEKCKYKEDYKNAFD